MANSTVGTAYLEIVPKLSKSGMPSTLPGGAAAGKRYGEDVGTGASSALSAKAVAIGNILSNVAMQAASAFGQLFKDTLDNYANYEQLVGGVDTLFKDASATVQANAAAAFQTAGMSANEYMENVTSFSASLLQGLGGDTRQAASYADMAIRDMSDNANKMGTDIGRITDAYQGFAKQNYTMLDNLKLGYGGTKTEMQRLLADAEKISGQKFDISNYHDVVEAIHVMQTSMEISGYSAEELQGKLSTMSLSADEVRRVAEDMGISYEDAMKRMKDGTLTVEDANVLLGTTAKEAATTIEGSMKSMEAAWTNFTVGLMSGNGDIGVLFDQLVQSVGTVAKNILPRIGILFKTVFTQLPTYIGEAIAGMPDFVGEMLEPLIGSTAASAVSSGLGDIIAGFQDFAARMAPIGEQVIGMIQGVLPILRPVVDGIIKAVSGVASIISQILPPILSVVVPIVQTIFSVVSAAVSAIWTVIGGIIDWLAANVAPYIATFFEFISPYVQQFADTVTTNMQNIQPIVEGVMNVVRTVITNAWSAIVTVVTTAVNAIKRVIGTIKSIIGVVKGAFNAVKTAITTPINAAKDVISKAISTIKGIFSGLKLQLPHFELPHFVIDGGEIPWGIGGQGRKPTIDVRWYARGGYVDSPTLIGAGERGGEFIWPSYNPYMQRYADALASAMGRSGAVSTNVYIDGARMNDDAAIEGAFWGLMTELQRRYKLNGEMA